MVFACTVIAVTANVPARTSFKKCLNISSADNDDATLVLINNKLRGLSSKSFTLIIEQMDVCY